MEIASLFARIGADLSGLEKGLAQTETMLGGAGKKMTTLGGDLTRNLTLPLAALGGVAAKSAIDLDKEMRNIQSISKSTDAEIAELSGTFLDMSTDIKKTTDTAKNLAGGFYQIQSSGFAGADAMQVLEASTKAGSAGLASTATAAEAIAASLNAYGESADQAGAISDVLFETVNRGVVTFGELSGSLSNVIGVAAQAGVSIETVGAAVATMTKQGMEGAEATTALNQLILGLIKPSEDLATAIDSLGYSSGQAMLDALGLQGTLQALSDAGFNSTESLAELFPNVRALRAALSLTGAGAQMFVEDLEAMENAAGATDAAFQEQTKSIASQLKNLTNELTALGIELAGVVTPAATEMVGKLKDLTEGFRAMDVEAQKNVLMWVGIAVAAGPVLKVVGMLVTGWGTLAGAVSAALPVLAAAGTALSTLNPIVAVATAAIVGVGMAWNSFIRTTQEAGLEDTAKAWSDLFGELEAQGADTSRITLEYAKAQQRVNEQLEEGGLVAKLFVDKQALMGQAAKEVEGALFRTSKTYGEYYAALQRIGLESQAVALEFFNTEKGLTEVDIAAANHAQTLEQIAMAQERVNTVQQAAQDTTRGYANVMEFLGGTLQASQDDLAAMADAHQDLTFASMRATSQMNQQAHAMQEAQRIAQEFKLDQLEAQLNQDLGSPLAAFIQDLRFFIASGGQDFAGAFEAIKSALANNQITPAEAMQFSGELLASIDSIKVAMGDLEPSEAIQNIAETLKIPFEEAKKIFEEAGTAAGVLTDIGAEVAESMKPVETSYAAMKTAAAEVYISLNDIRTAILNGQPIAQAFINIVHDWGLEFANLKTNASGALTNLQNLLAFLQSHPGLLNAGNQRSFLPALEPPGAPGPTGPYTPPPTTDGGTSSGGTGPGFDIKAAGGDTFNIHINDTMAAALVLAEMDIRRRGRLALRMGG